AKRHTITYRHANALNKKVRIPTEVDDKLAWLVGLYLGDGWNHNRSVGFSLLPKDLARPALVDLIRDVFGVEPSARRQVVICSASISGMFKQSLELQGNVYTKRVPRWVFNLP